MAAGTAWHDLGKAEDSPAYAHFMSVLDETLSEKVGNGEIPVNRTSA
jgi:hypothetical protein